MSPNQLPKQRPRPRPSGHRAEDIIAQYGSLTAFMAAVGPKAPLEVPDLGFTDEENRRMDELLAEEDATRNI